MELKTLSEAYLEATEWNLATLDQVVTLKSSAKSAISRQRSICNQMLMVCARLDMGEGRPAKAIRVRDLLRTSKASGNSIEVCLDAFIARISAS